MDEPFSISIDNEVIKNSNDKKLLGVNLNKRLGVDADVTNICNRESQTMKRRMTMKTFIASEFGYCPLVWMFHSRKLNSQVNNFMKGH